MSISPVNIFVPFDVVFAEITTGLDFDQIKRNFAGIDQAVNTQRRQIDGFVFMKNEGGVVLGHFGNPVDHDPVLRPVMMPLQREERACVDGNPLDLETVAVMDRLIESPGPVDPGVERGLVAFFGLQPVDDGFHVLGAVERQDEHRIHRGDHGKVLDPPVP